MDNLDTVYKILARGLLDIRIASVEGDQKIVFELSDLLHNIPLQLTKERRNNSDYHETVEWIRMRCEQKKMVKWLNLALSETTNLS